MPLAELGLDLRQPELLADELVEALAPAAPTGRGRRRRRRRSRSPRSARRRRRARSSRGCRRRSASRERQTTMSGWIPMRRSSLTECCVGFVFSSPAVSMNGHERDVDVETFSGPASRRNWRIASRNGSDSMSPTVPPISVMTTSQSLASADAADALLDLVRDVRDHLHGRAEVLALALLAEHAVPDRAGGVVRVAREVLVDEALVVADVEVGLGAVLGDEHLAVLERAHRPGVDVEVRVELLHLHLQPARLQQPPERRGGDALAERRDDAAGDEDVLRRSPRHYGRPQRVEPRRERACARSARRGSASRRGGESRERCRSPATCPWP